MRGKGKSVSFFREPARITPACAGKRKKRDNTGSFQEDHPRVCGEKGAHIYHFTHLLGSPPRVRGKVIQFQGQNGPNRITPACAGKRDSQGQPIGRVKDHPRVCGEKFEFQRFLYLRLGSPPRVRGKVRTTSSTCLFS